MDARIGIRPAVLLLRAFVRVVLGVLLFVWAFRLYVLFVRVRNRPVAKTASMSLGPVALEGKVQPASVLLAGAWIVVFAVSVLIDREMSAALAEALGTITS